MSRSTKILTAVVAGAAVGALMGVLFAPAKGSDTRNKIKSKGKEFSENLKEKFNDGKRKMQSFGEEVQQMVRKTEEA